MADGLEHGTGLLWARRVGDDPQARRAAGPGASGGQRLAVPGRDDHDAVDIAVLHDVAGVVSVVDLEVGAGLVLQRLDERIRGRPRVVPYQGEREPRAASRED